MWPTVLPPGQPRGTGGAATGFFGSVPDGGSFVALPLGQPIRRQRVAAARLLPATGATRGGASSSSAAFCRAVSPSTAPSNTGGTVAEAPCFGQLPVTIGAAGNAGLSGSASGTGSASSAVTQKAESNSSQVRPVPCDLQPETFLGTAASSSHLPTMASGGGGLSSFVAGCRHLPVAPRQAAPSHPGRPRPALAAWGPPLASLHECSFSSASAPHISPLGSRALPGVDSCSTSGNAGYGCSGQRRENPVASSAAASLPSLGWNRKLVEQDDSAEPGSPRVLRQGFPPRASHASQLPQPQAGSGNVGTHPRPYLAAFPRDIDAIAGLPATQQQGQQPGQRRLPPLGRAFNSYEVDASSPCTPCNEEASEASVWEEASTVASESEEIEWEEQELVCSAPEVGELWRGVINPFGVHPALANGVAAKLSARGANSEPSSPRNLDAVFPLPAVPPLPFMPASFYEKSAQLAAPRRGASRAARKLANSSVSTSRKSTPYSTCGSPLPPRMYSPPVRREWIMPVEFVGNDAASSIGSRVATPVN